MVFVVFDGLGRMPASGWGLGGTGLGGGGEALVRGEFRAEEGSPRDLEPGRPHQCGSVPPSWVGVRHPVCNYSALHASPLARGWVGSGTESTNGPTPPEPFPLPAGGVCWLQQGREATCSLVLRTDISQAECCASASIDTAWSNFTHPGNKISLLGFLGLVHCLPCKESCAYVVCPRPQSCVVDQTGSAHCVVCRAAPCPAPSGPGQELCGNNNVTYVSSCHLRQATCFLGRSIGVRHPGSCTGTPPEPPGAESEEEEEEEEEENFV
ncbi:follistatin-related protein 3 isoform X3 [Lemur catta]|uniref:follistatin-related protein 3 isoform X3 n=1 Tax=Lemur catta TaxID=9447 RepID=UPI001E26B66C|nr:follistatin-related protein 3 isoform X3 [Lemur catta]